MELRFGSLSIFQFLEMFPTDENRIEYLTALKWKDGFQSTHCGQTKYCSKHVSRSFDSQ